MDRAAWFTPCDQALPDPLLVVLWLGWCPSLLGWGWD